MATFDTSRTAYGSSAAVSGFSAAISRTFAAIASWNDARVTRNSLSALSDRELEDIGLVRGDIDNVASSDFIR